ncbi:hypothetical protein HAX54_019741, partial [Datura stramonium]|nr:hypothetical protein [Datura stramonium]
ARALSPKTKIEIEDLPHQPEGVGPAHPPVGFVTTPVRYGAWSNEVMRREAYGYGNKRPFIKVFLVVLSPKVEVLLVEVTLNTFNLAGLFRRHYKLH